MFRHDNIDRNTPYTFGKVPKTPQGGPTFDKYGGQHILSKKFIWNGEGDTRWSTKMGGGCTAVKNGGWGGDSNGRR